MYNPIAQRIIHSASAGGRIRLIVDVTTLHGKLKLFTVSIAYRRRAVPLMWKVIDKAGVTDAATQIELLEHLIPLISKGVEVVIRGDGEFRSTGLIGWLYTKRWHYRLRVAKDTYIRDEYGEGTATGSEAISRRDALSARGFPHQGRSHWTSKLSHNLEKGGG
ncbi:MAG: transposase [bacterium]